MKGFVRIHRRIFLQLFCAITIATFQVCSNDKNDQQKSEKLISSVSFEEVVIPIDTLSLVYYKKNCAFDLKGVQYFAGYNQVRHTIDIYNLDSKSLHQHITLERQGPNKVMKIYGIFVHNLDSIFIFDPTGIKLLNQEGVAHELTYSLSTGTLIAASGSSIFYDDQTKSILMYFQANDFEFNSRNAGLLKPIVAEYYLESKKIDLLPIHYSHYIQQNKGDFSSDIIPNLSFYKDKIICNFTVDSEICLYNREGNLTGCYPALSNTANNRLAPYSQDGMGVEQRMLSSTIFQKVYYLKNENLYVRAHWGNQPLLTPDMKSTTMMSKPAFLMIFDREFNILLEIPLNREKYFADDYFATSEALYIWRDFTKTTDEDSLRLGRMCIDYVQ